MGQIIFYDEKFEWGSRKALHTFAGDWMNLKQYHKYEMAWLAGKDHSTGPERSQFTTIRWWMQDNLNGEIIVKYGSGTYGTTVYLYFQHEDDMVAFKLRWE